MTRNNNKFNNNYKELGEYNKNKFGKSPANWQKAATKAFSALRQGGNLTSQQQSITQDVIEAAAFFGVKDFKGATRRHNNKLRKTLSGYGQDVPPARPSTRHTPKADPIPYANRERKICPRCNKLAKHRATECRMSRPSANKALISKGTKLSKDLNNASRKVTTANFSTINNGEDASDEESRYPILGTKAIEDGHTYENMANFTHTTSAMDFSKLLTNTGNNCFSHGTSSSGSFMDLYGRESRGPRIYSTDLQLFMLNNITYDNESSDETSVTNNLSNIINNNNNNILPIIMSTDVEHDSGSLRANDDTLECVEILGPDNLSLGLVRMQNVVSTGDGGTSSSTLHDATFVLEPGSIIGSEPMSSLDLNVNGCNDLDSLSNVNIGSDQLITSSSALSATNINIIVPLIPTPIPHPAFEQYHFNEIINDRLRTFRRLNHNILIIRVRQMNAWRAM